MRWADSIARFFTAPFRCFTPRPRIVIRTFHSDYLSTLTSEAKYAQYSKLKQRDIRQQKQ